MGNIHQIKSSPNRDATMSKSLLNNINKKNNVKFPTAVSLCANAATRMGIIWMLVLSVVIGCAACQSKNVEF